MIDLSLGGDACRIFLETFTDAQIYEIEEHEKTTKGPEECWNGTNVSFKRFWQLVDSKGSKMQEHEFG
jgi:hypothetical protein